MRVPFIQELARSKIFFSLGMGLLLYSSFAAFAESSSSLHGAAATLISKNYGDYKPDQGGRSEPTLKLMGHVPPDVSKSRVQNRMDAEQELSISISFNFNHEDELNKLLDAIYDPSSPNYRHYLTADEFKAKFHPTEDQFNQTEVQLEQKGIHAYDIQGGILKAKGKVSAIEDFFHTEIYNYTDTTGKRFFAPAYEIQVPLGSPIRAVLGLSNTIHPRSHLVPASPVSGGSGGSPKLSPLSGVEQNITGAQVRAAYNVPSNLTGSGQILALVELDGYKTTDITAYETANGYPNVPMLNILLDSFSGAAGSNANEVTLDIELMISMAPAVQQIRVYEGTDIWDIYNEMANPKVGDKLLPRVISSSWGAPESDYNSSSASYEGAFFKQMAAQGQTLFVASGDSGAFGAGGTTLVADDPSSQPYVIGTGGTTIYTQGSGNYTYDHETAWSGGGGGSSQFWTIPTWQAGVLSTASKGSTKMRNTPDISLNSDPHTGYRIILNGSWVQYGGTSAAAPLWAAFMSLINQQLVTEGQATLGFFAPTLYQFAKLQTYVTNFHDIADNSTNGFYPAVTGFDDSTGWGSFNGSNFVSGLTNATPVPTPTTPVPSATPSPTPSVTPSPSPVCVRNNPTMMLTPGSSVGSGTTPVTYTITIIDNNSAPCGYNVFSDSALVSGNQGFSTHMEPNNVITLPGKSSTAVLTITPNGIAPAGNYTVTVTGRSIYASTSTATTTATLVYRAAACVRGAPVISLNPANLTVGRGGTGVYTATVTNTDSNNCGLSVLSQSTNVPYGISVSLSSNNLLLAPGTSTPVQMTIKVPTTFNVGNYTVSDIAVNSNYPGHSGSGTGILTVQ